MECRFDGLYELRHAQPQPSSEDKYVESVKYGD